MNMNPKYIEIVGSGCKGRKISGVEMRMAVGSASVKRKRMK